MTIPVYNQNADITGELDVNPLIFDVKVKTYVMNEAVRSQRALARENIAHTKDRGEVRGGGKKPWKQKGTGRARHGSIRSPLWKGGGVTFGPRNTKNFAKKINKKVRRQALCMALTERAKDKAIRVLENISALIDKGKTKNLAELLKRFDINNKHVLISLENGDTKTIRAIRNLPSVKLTAPNSLNVRDILWGDAILTTVKGIRSMEKTYGTA